MFKRCVVFVAFCLSAVGQDKSVPRTIPQPDDWWTGPGSVGLITVNIDPHQVVFQVTDGGKVTMTIRADGAVVFGDGVKPDDAMKKFVEYVQKYMPCPSDSSVADRDHEVKK